MRTTELLLALPLGIILATKSAPAGNSDQGQESGPPAPQAEQSSQDDVWRRIYAREVAGWEVASKAEQSEPLTLVDRPVMHWASVDDFNGDVFVWTRNGQVELIGTIFSYSRGANPPERHVRAEFHSLSAEALELDHPAWGAVTIDAGVKLKELPDAQPPSPRPRLRQAQMRNIARQFAAHMDHHGERWELRLLPQALYQNSVDMDEPPTDTRQPADVALFAFVGFATDPELLLLVHGRRSAEGDLRWLYQPMRFSNRSLWLRFNEREIWKSLRGVQVAEDPDAGSYKLLPSRLLRPDIETKS